MRAYGCDDGPPRDGQGKINKSDLNFNGLVMPIASNRLVVTADADGDVCFYTSTPAAMIVDISGVATSTDLASIANQRTDTRPGIVKAGKTYKVNVADAVGCQMVTGQLTVDRATSGGYVTAWDCSSPRPVKSDLNFDGAVSAVESNRLLVKANNNGDICFYGLCASEPHRGHLRHSQHCDDVPESTDRHPHPLSRIGGPLERP